MAARPHLAARVGPVDTAPSWAVQEVSDGNINFVFLVQGPVGGVCIKQGLGFVRCVGEAWPLSQVRCVYECVVCMSAWCGKGVDACCFPSCYGDKVIGSTKQHHAVLHATW